MGISEYALMSRVIRKLSLAVFENSPFRSSLFA